MPDIPGNSTTTSTISVGGSTTNVLEVNGDHDWFRVELAAGQKIVISVAGITLADSYVRVRDALGSQLAENDDISTGVVLDSRLVFTAPSSGTFYIDVSAFADQYSGTYQLSVETYTPPPVASLTTIAIHLTSGYWGGDSHHFNVTQGGTITVNLTALTVAGQALAREALFLWSDIIGVTFTQVTSGGQIRFDDNEEGAHAEGQWSNGITSSAQVNVSTQWLTTYGTTIGSYSFQTYVHEIGHALGLGHGGFYNGDGNYADDALFSNDGWPTTIMSYFDQDESVYFNDLNFTHANVVTPMLADIRGMATLYGLSTTTRTGDTTYGFGNNSGRSVYSAAVGSAITALTIVDSGGNDTLNYSGYSSNQLINLNAETFSNIGGGVGNVSIGFGTIIENAIGGFGSDILIGNSGNNVLTGGGSSDTQTGGGGNDIFRDTRANFSFDTITDFSVGDAIVFTDATLGSFTFSLSGSTLTYTGGSLTLTGGVAGSLVASAASGGGVQLTISPFAPLPDARNDFNGDGRSDILWRNANGDVTNWLGQTNGNFTGNAANSYNNPGAGWTVAGTGDFNGDGRDDILWRNASGDVTNWLGQTNGNFAGNAANSYNNPGAGWSVAGTGDFNGDGRDDILWRNTNGDVTNWLGQANGNFAGSGSFNNPGVGWSVAGTGDFNGDGRDDILWRKSNGDVTNWLGLANGNFAGNGANSYNNPGAGWSVAGTGDFNGDGRDDILWRNTNGTVTNWLGQANGNFTGNAANSYNALDNGWTVEAVGDYNGDGRDDILWRNANGDVTNWLGQANGNFVGNAASYNALNNVWQVQPEHPMV